ncbi:2Fe-2S ferredoxin-like protein [Buchnera aphidicola (Hyadaphis tataricae)]|uniref:2Fe-2S ferredoxin-like protein n=1 Tax=Buchnera aphidicola (Hyadaphis tataricae) TaxID=1241859 RepID=A0A4D6XZT7_9GAMM|nr:class I ribonucleotide reductase maintenance protein YfaE [Buchnera aphidicola]QCI21877.1 2Fe-2S ferredoxin-like protein [Buchnera aphidicola (Hyadaphis tataricae)]
MIHPIVFIINLKKKIIYRKKQNSLLFFLEWNNIPIEYQCRSGYCGMCRVKLIKGKILYSIKQPMAALLRNQEILSCCCIPDGNISIKI